MLRSQFRLSLRNSFRKNRTFTFINIIGFAIGFACLILSTLFIEQEYSFDRYHKKFDRIYRVILDFSTNETITNWAKTSAPIGPAMASYYSEIESVVRLRKTPGTELLTQGTIQHYENGLFFIDCSAFSVFDFSLSRGDERLALSKKNSIVLTEQLAKKYFNDEDPIGKIIRYNNQTDLVVTGILNEISPQSHFMADAFISFSSLDDLIGLQRLTHWGQFDHYTYVLLKENVAIDQVENNFHDLLKTHAPEWVPEKMKLHLQPIASIHLTSHRKDEINSNSLPIYSHIMGSISLFILLMVVANFINLSTAMYASRLKQVSVQKIFGAGQHHLQLYFWVESILISFLAVLLSLLLVYLILPAFNFQTGLSIALKNHYWLIPASIGLSVVIGFFAGFFPMWQTRKLKISGSQIIQYDIQKNALIRFGLISFQLVISIALITVAYITVSQYAFVRSTKIGFDNDRIITLPIKDRSLNDRYQILINELRKLSFIENVSFSSSTPALNNGLTYTYTFEGTANENAITTYLIDPNFIDVYHIGIKRGVGLNHNPTDSIPAILINEAAVKEFNLKNPIGQLVKGKINGRIVGVIEDFNHNTLHAPITPVIFYVNTATFRFVSIKFTHQQIQNELPLLANKWTEFYPGYPLEYDFHVGQVDMMYQNEKGFVKAVSYFTVISIFLSLVGLLGLSVYLQNKRRKEISIRKILGSSTQQIIFRIYAQYFKIIFIAAVISSILSYVLMNEWLQGFAFRTEMKISFFVYPVLFITMVLVMTTTVNSLRAALTNPVENLRNE